MGFAFGALDLGSTLVVERDPFRFTRDFRPLSGPSPRRTHLLTLDNAATPWTNCSSTPAGTRTRLSFQ